MNIAVLNSRRRRAVLAAVIVVGLASAAAAAYNHNETAAQCTAALKEAAAVDVDAEDSSDAAQAALTAVTSTTLADSTTSTSYADRPAVTEAGDAAHEAGATLISGVSEAETALIKITGVCGSRAEAQKITAKTSLSRAATAALNTSVTALTADFAVFQAEEVTRIAAEVEAARVAAEVEAARVAAEAEAARVAAEAAAEADRRTAEREAASSDDGGGYSNSGGAVSDGGSSASPPVSSTPHGNGSFRVGSGSDNVSDACRIDNGVGGFVAC